MTKTKKKAAPKKAAAKKPATKKLVKAPTKEKVKTRVVYTANVREADGKSWTEIKNGNLRSMAGHKEVKAYKTKAEAEKASKNIAKTLGNGATGYASERSTNLNIPRKNCIRKKGK